MVYSHAHDIEENSDGYQRGVRAGATCFTPFYRHSADADIHEKSHNLRQYPGLIRPDDDGQNNTANKQNGINDVWKYFYDTLLQ